MNEMTGFNKESFNNFLGGSRSAAKSMETIKDEMQAFGTQQFKEGMAALEAVKAAKSVPEAMELQFKFARNLFDAYLQQTRKLGELSFDFMQQNFKRGQDVIAPVKAQAEAVAGKFAKTVVA